MNTSRTILQNRLREGGRSNVASEHRINVAMGPRLKKAAENAARRRGVPSSSFLRMLLVEHLRSTGDITDADLEADAETPKVSE
jgi:hypothetical protein